jgi:hypothetical protein
MSALRFLSDDISGKHKMLACWVCEAESDVAHGAEREMSRREVCIYIRHRYLRRLRTPTVAPTQSLLGEGCSSDQESRCIAQTEAQTLDGLL